VKKKEKIKINKNKKTAALAKKDSSQE